ncbi:hypothetical protein Asppvi_002623 [Aspergillus pseudoviridinutans]|uniref:Uncharacterized protein n=1 Tax=Aspergillus pseudoviridinutans TaxID=1517512 RepID=A0A9P3B8F6_9EURO|nr:uncharacterized protein Asppvi_002623 [Aspergillus pseudoviridinutans]GIJ83793.1 hypothetical protein Asppvi_002623 [Aspergillus pseudoviridinutans]
MGCRFYTGCVVCGIEAGFGFCQSICGHYRDLKESGQGAQLLWLDADELERTYRFREKEEWVGTYRLIYFDRSSQAYRLSGIAHLADPIETYFKAPIDRNQACIGLTNRDPSGLVRYHVQNVALWSSSLAKPVDWREFAFAVHASCWSLTLRFVDADVENHLHSILAASLKRMTELHTEEFLVWDSWKKKRRAQGDDGQNLLRLCAGLPE